MSSQQVRKELKVGYGIENLVSKTKIKVPYAVMAATEIEWYPIWLGTELSDAVEVVKEILVNDPNTLWDIQSVEIPLVKILDQIS